MRSRAQVRASSRPRRSPTDEWYAHGDELSTGTAALGATR
jgi:hypothetical protein